MGFITEIDMRHQSADIVVLKESIVHEYFDIHVEKKEALLSTRRRTRQSRRRINDSSRSRTQRRAECTSRIQRLIDSINLDIENE